MKKSLLFTDFCDLPKCQIIHLINQNLKDCGRPQAHLRLQLCNILQLSREAMSQYQLLNAISL